MTARADHWAVWLTLLLCVLAFVLGVVFMPGPSDTEAAADTAADLQEAPQQARADRRDIIRRCLSGRGHRVLD